MVFFSRNKKTALDRLNYLKKVEPWNYKEYSKVKLAKKQIPHQIGWKTWVLKK